MQRDFGHIKISRKVFRDVEANGCPFWNEKREFSRYEAWVYLIQAAKYQPISWALPSARTVELARGETHPLSIRYLMQAWGWGSKKRVDVFLTLLIQRGQLRTGQRTPIGDTYVLVNYELYQGDGDTSGDSTGDAGGDKKEAGKAGKEEVIAPRVMTREDRDRHADSIIRAANKGAAANPNLGDACHPIPPGHSSRQDVIDWMAEGIAPDVIQGAVYLTAKEFKPNRRNPRISSMRYFAGPVHDAAEAAAALAESVPGTLPLRLLRPNRGETVVVPPSKRLEVLRDKALPGVLRSQPAFVGGLPDPQETGVQINPDDYALWDQVLQGAGLKTIREARAA